MESTTTVEKKSKKQVTKTDVVFNDRIITLRSVYDKTEMPYTTMPCKNKHGVYPKCVKKVDSNGNMILSEKERDAYAEGREVFFPETHLFKLWSGKTYHLDDPYEAAEWEAVQNCPYIAKSRDERDEHGNLIIDGPISTPQKPARNGIASLYIDRPGLETARTVKKDMKIHKACAFIYDDPHGLEGQLNMARLLGKNMQNQPAADVIDYLIRVAKNDPDKIIKLYTGDDISLRLTFIEAKEKHIIYMKDKVYIYGDNIPLGATDEAVINWMKEPRNQKVFELIKKDTYPDYYVSAD